MNIITIDELDEIQRDNSFKITDTQHIKINNFIDEHLEKPFKIYKKDKGDKLIILLKDSAENQIKVFLKKKTKKELTKNEPFNSWENRQFWT
jgi:hypothetical protein